MARPKINPEYDPVKARDKLVQAVTDLYLHPQSVETMDQDGHTTMKEMMNTFGLSATKIRKLLVTGGHYHFYKTLKNGRKVDMVKEVSDLIHEGKNTEEISSILEVSRGTVSSFMPYQSGVYHADFTADGYDLNNVSTDARRQRNQRKRNKMKEESVMKEKKAELHSAEQTLNELRDRKSMDKALLKKVTQIHDSGLWFLITDEIYGVGENIILSGEKDSILCVSDEYGISHYFTLLIYNMPEDNPFQLIQMAEVHQVMKAEDSDFNQDCKHYIDENGNRWNYAADDSNTDFNFQFSYKKSDEEAGKKAIETLIQKTVLSLQNLTLDKTGYAKETGTIRIEDDENGETVFRLDGEECSPEELMQYFNLYVGFDLAYQIMDPSSKDVIENGMVLVPMKLNEEVFTQDLNDLLYTMTIDHKGKFLSKKDVPAFDVMFGKITDKYEYYCRYSLENYGRLKDEVINAGKKMIQILNGIGTDDDLFPAYETGMIEAIMKLQKQKGYDDSKGQK